MKKLSIIAAIALIYMLTYPFVSANVWIVEVARQAQSL